MKRPRINWKKRRIKSASVWLSSNNTFNVFSSLSTCKSRAKNQSVSNFLGCITDTGAQKSVMGLKKASAYCSKNQIKFGMKKSHARFKFADQVEKSLGRMTILMSTPRKILRIEVDVITAIFHYCLDSISWMKKDGL